ncbi:MAG: hypothetical protein CMJ33_06625 [Phycisphaerae bacterium]|nr:hypothetical protein [Phycisphaerae bacterium]HAW96188.1 hypothetical protein [Phycisphaerales bacterium]|tara:strand:- start:343 stop:765 length:423 start_codon:yes stop_codon:yes gene_type:complete
MWIAAGNEFDRREKKFFGTMLRRGYVSSSLVKLLILLSMTSYSIALACAIDSGFQGHAGIAFTFALGWSALTLIAILMDRRKRMRDVLLSLDRCGECGQKLTGSHTYKGRGINARSCCECGTLWTDLDRQASIESIYRST